jgi:hypothetical protein
MKQPHPVYLLARYIVVQTEFLLAGLKDPIPAFAGMTSIKSGGMARGKVRE